MDKMVKRDFVLEGKMFFEAVDITDAFLVLQKHFLELYNEAENETSDEYVSVLLPKTDIHIHPVKTNA